ncbi:MAG: hypothetical protein FWB80_00430 [Defluviitaleaceae bacterium]|nr:hypothetical protein [Defluviitaleaceae bacterium]
MLVTNPKSETYDEIRDKYDGYCVLVIECESKKQNFGYGKVVAYSKNLADLNRETRSILKEDIGIFVYKTFTDFGSFAPTQVVHHV